MDNENISAFAAYLQQSSSNDAPATETAAGADAEDSFLNLSRNEMIARLINKKKLAIKRKNPPADGVVSTKKPRKKKGESKSAPVSQNTSLSPTKGAAVTVDGEKVASVKKAAKKTESKSFTNSSAPKVAEITDDGATNGLAVNGGSKNEEKKKKTKKTTTASVATTPTKNTSPEKPSGTAEKVHKHPFHLRINPKDPLELTFFTSSSRNKKSPNGKSAKKAPKPIPQSTTSNPSCIDPNQTADFSNVVQSTPKPPVELASPGSSSKKKKSKNSSLAAETLRKSFARSASNISADEHPTMVAIKPEPVTIIETTIIADETLVNNPDVNLPLRMVSSIESAKDLLSWIIDPKPLDTFMETAWEKTPLLIARKCPSYYSGLLSTEGFDKMLREQRVEFTKNLDVTSYVDGVRTTHNPEGRALPPTVWDFYASGCSIRLLNPQTFLPVIHSMNATLQEYFQCMTGANVYLTPANSQGFAPHYDDIEAFVLQIEGKKRWKVYKPRTVNEQLPRESSPNFSQSEIGEPIMDVVLEAGDLLYFPRGYIHQATTVPGFHSLHITLSAYQKNTYGDLLELLLPAMLQSTIAENVLLRQGVPLNIWQNLGLVHSDDETRDRAVILKKIKACLDLTMKSLAEHVDDAVDKMAARFQHDALPPYVSDQETARTVVGTKAVISAAGVVDQPLVELDTPLRLVRANVVRLVRQSADEFRVYYHTDNSKEYHQFEPTFAEISAEDAPAVEFLIKAYPEFSLPKDLPIESDEQCLAVAQDLWERGVLVTKDILQ